VRVIRWLLGWLLTLCHIVASLLALVLVIVFSWRLAPHDCMDADVRQCERLRWAVTTRESIVPGEQITARMLDQGLRRTSLTVESIPLLSEVVNQYAYAAIPANALVERQAVGPIHWLPAGPDTLVPVAADPEFATGITTGARVVFATRVDKVSKWAGLPKCNPKSGLPVGSAIAGFIVVSKSDGGDHAKAVITVSIPNSDTESIQNLSDGVWRPIVLSGPKLCQPGKS
jgi:hypothetical protein